MIDAIAGNQTSTASIRTGMPIISDRTIRSRGVSRRTRRFLSSGFSSGISDTGACCVAVTRDSFYPAMVRPGRPAAGPVGPGGLRGEDRLRLGFQALGDRCGVAVLEELLQRRDDDRA